ncbi:hypothetical protein QE152_g24835 [Popillia japonica]|uniref:Uncharacterized protein n=1 Tax=Popillia japonica TaxID=7064 RepID=A0AAW1K2D3_POPJA
MEFSRNQGETKVMLAGESENVQQRPEATEPVSSGKMILKPPIFDGLISWNNSLRQFEITAKSNSWTEDLKAGALANSLRGKALDILETMLPGEETRSSRKPDHADVERLLRLTNPDGSSKMEDAWPLHIFINGIREGETQQHIRLARPKTLAEALGRAQEYEVIKQVSKGQSGWLDPKH